ncbi:zinc finger protein DZIP1L-like isoform X2 [Asterias rubens]|uniref:zinc finger protein DZIP1L-like isoform X2 n=1 Tax=Asterias rubens TaxID=7604 RepID=UPI001455AE00|nr:zinc finger protein DZIP1L-like isoform X2 [Asterias rubens]
MHGSYYPSPRGAGGATSYAYTNGHVPGDTPRAAPTSINGVPGFTFQTRHDRIDWRKMASVDVDRVMRELDFATLQDVIMNVTFCDITAEVDMRSMDPNFVKLFQLSQLIAEYLLHSQNYLTHSIGLTQDKVQQVEGAHNSTKAETIKLKEELKKQKDECHKRKKMLKQQQNLIQAGANNYHKCPYCSKAFVHSAYLQSHVQRKHSEYLPPSADSETKKQSQRMEHEIEELRERLRMTETQMEEERRLIQSQMTAQRESQAKEESRRLEELQKQQMENWKQEQLESHRADMERMKDMFMKELKEMNDKYSNSQSALDSMQSKYGKRSMLGTLQDEDDIADLKELVKKQKEENEQRNRDLQEKLASTQSSLQDQNKKFKEQTKQMKTDHGEEMQHLKKQLKETRDALKMEQKGGSNSSKKSERRIQQLEKESKEYQRSLKEKDREIKLIQSRPPPLVAPPVVKPALVSTPVTTNAHPVLEARRLDLHYAQKSPAKPPPSPPAKKPKPVLLAAKSVSSTEAEDSEIIGDSDEEEGEISVRSNPHDPLDEDEMAKMKEGLSLALQRNLEKCGVPEGINGITARSLENKVKRLKEERSAVALRFRKFHDIRKSVKEEVERRFVLRLKGRGTSVKMIKGREQPLKRPKSTSPTPKSTPKLSKLKDSHPIPKAQPQPKTTRSTPHSSSAKTPAVSHAHQSFKERPRVSRQEPPPIAPRSPEVPKSSSLKSGTKVPGSPARVSFDMNGHNNFDDSDDDDDDIDDSVEESDEDISEDEEEESDITMDEEHLKKREPGPASQLAQRGNAEGMDDDSDWDSEDISELDEVSQDKGRASQQQQQQHQQRQQQPQGRQGRPVTSGRPKSPAIARMAESIERQLSTRRSDHKPVGGVDLGGTGQSDNLRPDSRDDGRSPSPRIPTLPDASDEDDDDESLAISSLDGSNYSVPRSKSASLPVPAPRQGRPPTAGSRKSDTDMSNTYGTSMWGSSKGHAESGTAKSSLVSVTDLDDDDFDLSDL